MNEIYQLMILGVVCVSGLPLFKLLQNKVFIRKPQEDPSH